MISKGRWVRIYSIILEPEDRSSQLPDDTSSVPLEMWVKGFLVEEGTIGDEVKVKTLTGRIVSGKLVEVDPTYNHNYGDFIPEILEIGLSARRLIFGGDMGE